jgi:multiple sugar transport system permease protein
MKQRETRSTRIALTMLAPNFLGFLIFTAGPVVFSLIMAFTNWDLTRHNQFSSEHVHFIGLENFATLMVGFNKRYFWQYLGNTLYLMLGMPVGIALSLTGALLLHGPLPRPHEPRRRNSLLGLVLVLTLFTVGVERLLGTGPLPIFFTVVTGLLVILGQIFGQTSFRTVYYLPNLTAGVAYFLLWKALYRPEGGPINRMLEPGLGALTATIQSTPPALWAALGGMLVLVAGLLVLWGVMSGLTMLRYRDATTAGVLLSWIGVGGVAAALIALGSLVSHLPQTVAHAPLMAPQWLSSTTWSKPALMFMGVFTAMGSNSMLLYLAALSNVPVSLQEAAAIDGATRWQSFWSVTWPQLAPTTFFIVIMGTIGGLQGGFDAARVMTGGGPAGSTTTLSYYLYNQGFVLFDLGMASAIAWSMFVLIFAVTMINWRFGNQMVND